VRDWLFVEDHCRALERILLAGSPGSTYCIGGNNEVANLDLVHQLCDLLDELAPELPQRPSRELIRFVADRPGHDRRYAIDASHIKAELGWEPQVSVAEGLRRGSPCSASEWAPCSTTCTTTSSGCRRALPMAFWCSARSPISATSAATTTTPLRAGHRLERPRAGDRMARAAARPGLHS
jgi:hypothetical protein